MKKLITILAIMTLLLMAGCGSEPNKYTLEKYNQIQTGMNYEQVSKIMGDGGKPQAETHQEGVPGVMPSITIKIYGWQNPDGSNLSVTFENNKTNMKAQAGLK